ncbi:FKBP-type peptidyl-prolyl cis-trans isomerase [Bizionia arctica]|uniref:peptidylprolyl isomerase n=1 Tax=Bizionia arctica TaxID=1495645 RepID=A0A917GXU1_9FLAO|nr:FKBP-type peptidyl-prolyl cis-trans isomerase [Bizionia arctica]GGG60296.1 hypothetical protein GCM10010976_33820 [Bizionia arctica]
MKIRNLSVIILCFGLTVFSCKEDDEITPEVAPVRDAQEVYDENILEIVTYLETHFYNYEEFEQNPTYSDLSAMPYTVTPNDNFEIVFDTIAGANSDKIPLIDQVTSEEVTSSDGIVSTLYYLVVRDGLGGVIHPIDQVFANYNGLLIDGTLFDSAISAVPFYLTTVGTLYGVVDGFKEGIIKFKARQGYTVNNDGTVTNHNHGIGAVFVPSGLGYSAQTQTGIPAYSNLIFSFSAEKRVLLDHDNDGVFSYLEDLNDNQDSFDDDTDGDGIPNFIDVDDDGDGVLTTDEIEHTVYTEDQNMMVFTSNIAAQVYYDTYAAADEVLYSIIDNNDGTFTLNTVIFTDSNDDGIPDYLDSSVY